LWQLNISHGHGIVDRELPADVVRKRKLKIYLRTAGIVLLIVVVLLVIRAAIRPTLSRERMRVAVAETGPVESTLSASGVVVPAYEEVLTSPIQSRIDTIYARSGDSARAGISLLKLNLEFIQMSYNKLSDELQLLENEKEQLNLKLDQSRGEAQAQYDIKELQTKHTEAELDRVKHLCELGGATRGDLDRARLNVDIAHRELQQLGDQLKNQEAMLSADLKELDLKIRIQNNKLAEVGRQIDLAKAKPDRGGVITWINDNIGASVAAGETIARIADLGSFKVQARISDIHAARLHPGGPVNVRLDSRQFSGTIASIDPSAKDGTITFLVDLDRNNDPSLRSNLRVDVYVVTSRVDSTIRVANGPFYDGSVDQKVFVLDGGAAVSRDIRIGATNYEYVELIGDVRVGDTVIISDMKRFAHMNEVKITN
jgi:HlyD family secretion protein